VRTRAHSGVASRRGVYAGSGLAVAINYMSKRWSRATLFLEHPDVRLDNNAAERAIRGVVLGRKK